MALLPQHQPKRIKCLWIYWKKHRHGLDSRGVLWEVCCTVFSCLVMLF